MEQGLKLGQHGCKTAGDMAGKGMKKLLPFPLIVLLLVILSGPVSQAQKKKKGGEPAPIRALLITGGCCHDYDMQKRIIMDGVAERAHVVWDLVYEQFEGKEHQIGIYKRKDWAKGYDVIVHNECYGGVSDDDFVNAMVKAHTDYGVGVVVLHCSMHSYRAAKTDEYRKLIGVSSFNHGKKSPIKVTKLNNTHPVIKALPEGWVTPDGELYNTNSKAHPDAKMWDSATPLAEGKIPSTEAAQTCIWVNEYKGCKTFGTTIGHHNETMLDPVYLDLLTRGLLWTCGKLTEDGTAVKGYGK